MENKPQIIQQEKRGNQAISLLGILVFLFACLSFSGAIVLDLTGEEAVGEVSNVSTGCTGSKTCWTGQVDFITQTGEAVSFHPLTAPMFFDLDPFLSGRPYEEYGKYQVRYLASYPKIAKVKLAYFLEYSTYFGGWCLGSFLMLVASAFSTRSNKSHKPMVIDLSQRRNK